MRLHAIALQNIRVNRSLSQEFDSLLLPRLLLEHADKLRADDLALLLRLLHTLQLVQEAVNRIHIHKVGVHLMAEHLHHLLRLPLAQKPMVHVDAHQLFADGLDQQGGHDGRIHSPRQSQKHLLVSHLLFDGLHLLFDESIRQFPRCDPNHIVRTFVVVHLFISFSVRFLSSPCTAAGQPRQSSCARAAGTVRFLSIQPPAFRHSAGLTEFPLPFYVHYS